jgi:hypothetical protein
MFKTLKNRLAMRRLRKSYPAIADFKPEERLDQLIKEHRVHGYTGTAISLDRDGFTPDQIEEWHRIRRAFIQAHGSELLEYLKPYKGVNGQELGGLHFVRWFVGVVLLQEIAYYKKTETE